MKIGDCVAVVKDVKKEDNSQKDFTEPLGIIVGYGSTCGWRVLRSDGKIVEVDSKQLMVISENR